MHTDDFQDLIRKVVNFFQFKIELIQTDNGTEWTSSLISSTPTPTLFEAELEKPGIKYTGIHIAAPRHNGKVERQYRRQRKPNILFFEKVLPIIYDFTAAAGLSILYMLLNLYKSVIISKLKNYLRGLRSPILARAGDLIKYEETNSYQKQ